MIDRVNGVKSLIKDAPVEFTTQEEDEVLYLTIAELKDYLMEMKRRCKYEK